MQTAAEQLGLTVWQPETLNADAAVEQLRQFGPDLLVVCDYGEILKAPVLAAARLGGVNLHGSLLPQYRGAAPVQWAVLNGDARTGNTVIQMSTGLDAGPILAAESLDIDPDETAGELERRLSERGGALVLQTIEALQAGTAEPRPQDRRLASKAPRLDKQDGAIDWTRPAAALKNQVRALDPWPRAFTHWRRPGGEPLRLILHRVQAVDAPAPAPPGAVVEAGPRLVVAAGEGALGIQQLQPSGKRVLEAAEFLRGYPVAAGAEFGA